MDYEQKYKELVERLKQAKETKGGYTFCSVLDDIIPELKESEDEIMRKAIIQFTKENGYKYTNYNGRKIAKEEMIAWLKSLRPQPKWKPSERSLNSILDAIIRFEGQGINAIELKKLLEQLKKL